MPNLKRIGGGPWKNGQKSVDLTWNDPSLSPSREGERERERERGRERKGGRVRESVESLVESE